MVDKAWLFVSKVLLYMSGYLKPLDYHCLIFFICILEFTIRLNKVFSFIDNFPLKLYKICSHLAKQTPLLLPLQLVREVTNCWPTELAKFRTEKTILSSMSWKQLHPYNTSLLNLDLLRQLHWPSYWGFCSTLVLLPLFSETPLHAFF